MGDDRCDDRHCCKCLHGTLKFNLKIQKVNIFLYLPGVETVALCRFAA